MAEDDDDDENGEDNDEDGEGKLPRKASKAKLFIIIGVVLLLVVGGAGAAYFMGFLDPLLETGSEEGEEPPAGEATPEQTDEAAGEATPEQTEEAAAEAPSETVGLADAVFYEIPEMVVNLNVPGSKPKFLKLQFNIVLTNAEDVPKVDARLAHILDNCQSYLRELRVEDLKGSAGMSRMREGVLLRVTASVSPIQVLDVLFKQVLVQ